MRLVFLARKEFGVLQTSRRQNRETVADFFICLNSDIGIFSCTHAADMFAVALVVVYFAG